MKLKRANLFKDKKILKSLAQIFPAILLLLILVLVSILSIKSELFLLSNDNYSPELSPNLSVSRYLESPAWRGYRVLGFASESEQADLFRSSIFSFLDVFLPKWSLAQAFSLISLVVGVFSMAFLSRYIIRDYVSKKYSGYVFLISGILYFTTLWTAWVFNFNMMPYITQYGFLPLVLLSIYLLCKKISLGRFLFFFFASILFTSSSVIATVFFVNIVLIVLFTIYFGLLNKLKYKAIFLILGVFLLTQIFWLLPFVQYTFSSSQDIIDSYVNRSITANTIDLEAGMMDLTNSARFYTRLLGTIDDPAKSSYIFPMSEDFQAYDIFKVVGSLPIIFSIIGLVFVISKKKWKIIPFWIVLFGLLFLLKNENPPFGIVYVWFQENIPLFKQVFRWVSSKLSQQYLIVLVITTSIGMLYLFEFFASYFPKKLRKLFMIIPGIVFITIFLFYSEYLFKGQLFTSRAIVDLPSQYFSLKDQLKDDEKSRVFYAPPANNGYFREYEWGFVGSQFLGYILPNPLIDMSLAIGSDVGERAVLELKNDFDFGDITELNADLEKYDVKYILLDRSLIKGRYGYAINWDYVDDYTKTWEKVWFQDFLELYELKDKETTSYIESYGQNDVLDNGHFVRKQPREPIFSPLNVDLDDAYIKGDSLFKEIKYEGVDTILYSKYEEIDFSSLPTRLKKSGKKLSISLSLPSVNNLINETHKTYSLPEPQGYLYILEGSVFTQEQVERGVNVYDKWGSIQHLYTTKISEMEKKNLTDTFSKSEPGDCSGGDYRVMPNVTPQKITSGFSIEGTSELPCLFTKLRLDMRKFYAMNIDLNWENDGESILGYCLYSASRNGCLNKEKFLYSSQGYGDVSLTVPEVVAGSDDLSLTLYAFNPKGNKAELLIRNVEISYSSELTELKLNDEYTDRKAKMLEINKGEELLIEIPLMSNGSSYIYTPEHKKGVLWQPTVAEDSTLIYDFSLDNGMKQATQNQYINQYQELFVTNPLKKYLWYWSGNNTKNIPATLCLTYINDDKCIVDSTFYDDILSSGSRIFIPSTEGEQRLDASFNSISFKNESENVLQDFVVMEIPNQWIDFRFESTAPRIYTEVEAKSVGSSVNSTMYKIEKEDIDGRDIIVSIPQAKSDGWIAIAFTNFFFKILGNKTKVYLDGWKQGWDISTMNRINNIFVFYWPNVLSYLGYLCISIIPIFSVFYFYKGKKAWKRESH